MSQIKVAVSILVLGVLCACGTTETGRVYRTGEVGQKMRVHLGTVVEIKDVVIVKKSGNLGSAIGSGTGSIAGATIGSTQGNFGQGIAGAVAGAVIGGVVGAISDNVGRTSDGKEIHYRVDGNEAMFSTVQEGDLRVKVGDRIRIIEGSFSSKIEVLASN